MNSLTFSLPFTQSLKRHQKTAGRIKPSVLWKQKGFHTCLTKQRFIKGGKLEGLLMWVQLPLLVRRVWFCPPPTSMNLPGLAPGGRRAHLAHDEIMLGWVLRAGAINSEVTTRSHCLTAIARSNQHRERPGREDVASAAKSGERMDRS